MAKLTLFLLAFALASAATLQPSSAAAAIRANDESSSAAASFPCFPGQQRPPWLPPCPAPPPQPSECYTSVSGLTPCADFLTNARVHAPAAACCDGLKAIVTGAPICLCHVYNGDFGKLLPAPVLRLRLMALPRVCRVRYPPGMLGQCMRVITIVCSRGIAAGSGIVCSGHVVAAGAANFFSRGVSTGSAVLCSRGVVATGTANICSRSAIVCTRGVATGALDSCGIATRVVVHSGGIATGTGNTGNAAAGVTVVPGTRVTIDSSSGATGITSTTDGSGNATGGITLIKLVKKLLVRLDLDLPRCPTFQSLDRSSVQCLRDKFQTCAS
ncbi:hypothetical protein HU200_034096 [Digitaria exilis]|uniref:Bifunctional inhibitor/plant lipid transfer protein/seed storage helical domain-containing protein n=1 Tax=Digitaria exilis TaxID=1010633 RepID=A0A835BK63_9POAL|nr:hypothetical protein HU200_034096 [Digitaria exilis]